MDLVYKIVGVYTGLKKEIYANFCNFNRNKTSFKVILIAVFLSMYKAYHVRYLKLEP